MDTSTCYKAGFATVFLLQEPVIKHLPLKRTSLVRKHPEMSEWPNCMLNSSSLFWGQVQAIGLLNKNNF